MKRLMALIVSAALLLSLAAVGVLAADEETVTLDLAEGSITISATGYTQGSGAETPFTGAYTIVQKDTSYVDRTISVTGGQHKITMGSAIEIDVHAVAGACAFSVASGASVELVLTKPVTLKSGSDRAGLSVPTGAAVTISASGRAGSLYAAGGSCGAGIGGANTSGGNITILSGTIEAVGGQYAAGIGGYRDGTGKNEAIHIAGGKVTATGGSSAAGIGGGYNSYSAGYGAGTGEKGQIIIDGTAEVIASASSGAGIGGGCSSNGTGTGGKIILGGTAKITAVSASGAGIGSGKGYGSVYLTGSKGEVLITDDAVVEANSNSGAGIGGGEVSSTSSSSTYSYGTGSDGKLTINAHATVTAASSSASGIGGGTKPSSLGHSYTTGPNGVISISGSAVVKATGAMYGIGGYDTTDNGGSVNISGGFVTAMATDEADKAACGIGRTGKTTITGGTVMASGYTGIYSATVNGGIVTAQSLQAANGFASVTSNANREGWMISLPGQQNNTLHSGVLFSGAEGKIFGDFYELPGDREIPDGVVLSVNDGQELTIPTGSTLHVNGRLVVDGTLVVNGTLATAEAGEVELNGEATVDGKISGKLLPLNLHAKDQTTEQTVFDVSTLFTIPEEAGAAVYTVAGQNGADGTLEGSILTIQKDGIFAVTASTQATEHYQAAEAVAYLTAKKGIQEHVHQLIEFEEEAPDCLNPGNIHYWACQNCGKCFSDQSGTAEISYESTIRQASGHMFANGVCSVCGAEDPDYLDAAVIEASSLTAYPGDSIQVPIVIKNNPGISSMKLTITYDAAVLEYLSAAFDSTLTAFSDSNTAVNPTDGTVVLSWVLTNDQYDGNGNIAVLSFKVKGIEQSTDALIGISYNENDLFNKDLVNQKFLVKNGTVTIAKTRPGDINGDGTVDIQDALLLLQYTCGLRTDEVVGNPDVTGDGAVNNKDVVILLRYIAHIEGIVLH